MWTEITRANYDRSDLRCANDLTDADLTDADLTDAEWALIEPSSRRPSGWDASG